MISLILPLFFWIASCQIATQRVYKYNANSYNSILSKNEIHTELYHSKCTSSCVKLCLETSLVNNEASCEKQCNCNKNSAKKISSKFLETSERPLILTDKSFKNIEKSITEDKVKYTTILSIETPSQENCITDCKEFCLEIQGDKDVCMNVCVNKFCPNEITQIESPNDWSFSSEFIVILIFAIIIAKQIRNLKRAYGRREDPEIGYMRL